MTDQEQQVTFPTPMLDNIAANGNRCDPLTGGAVMRGGNKIVCADGFKLSVVAGYGMYCTPRPDGYESDVDETYQGPFTEVEVGYPSARPEPWDEWEVWCESPGKPTDTVYGYVPVDAVRALIVSHGGEA